MRSSRKPWHDTSVTYCQVCGRLIPRRAWVFDGGDGELRACDPECEDLYEDLSKAHLRMWMARCGSQRLRRYCCAPRARSIPPSADGSQDGALVRVHTDEGIVGLGEVDSSPAVAKAIIDAPASHKMRIGLAQRC